MANDFFELEAESKEQLIEMAKEHFDVLSDGQLNIEILDEGEKRNLLFQKKNFIRARVSLREKRPCDIEGFLKGIVKQIGVGDDIDFVENEDGSLFGEVIGFVPEDLQSGQEVLNALQHVASRYLIRTGNIRKISIDSQGLRGRRQEELDAFIREIHDTVMRGKTYTTDFLYPAERRQIHLGLESLGGVKTFSRGQGLRKRVVACPKSFRPRRSRNHRPQDNEMAETFSET